MLPFIHCLFNGSHESAALKNIENSQLVRFSGKVVGRTGHLQFTVRCEDGQFYKVQAAQYLTHLMGYHAKVWISGKLAHGIVRADSIVPLE